MISQVLWKISGLPVRDQRSMAKAIKESWLETIRAYLRVIAPKHFTHAGGREYGYQPRKARYQIGKAKKHGHQDPLVVSGEMRAAALTRYAATSTSKGGRLVYTLPEHAIARGKDNTQPDKIAELTKISPADLEFIARTFDDELQKRVDPTVLAASSVNRYAMPGVAARFSERNVRAGGLVSKFNRSGSLNVRNAKYFAGRF